MVKLKQIKFKSFLLKLLIVILLAVVGFILANAGYFWQNFQYTFFPNKIIVNLPSVTGSTPSMQPNLLIVPSLGITAPIQYVDVNSEKVFQQALQNGVVHYPQTADIGTVGNAYIFGHSSDFVFSKGSYKTIFALLPKIKIGDQIVVSDKSGEKFVYNVTKTKVVSPSDLSVLDQNTNGNKILTLQTSYPVGTALKRFVAIAQLAN
jgi:LPXTG-site transpeptidase (sortase) family protein